MAYDVEQLLKMSQTRARRAVLEQPRRADPGRAGRGHGDHRARHQPTARRSPSSSTPSPGRARCSTPRRASLRNRILPFGLNAIIAKVYKAPSWLDGKECIVLDYSETSLVAHWIRDEIRLIGPGLYLGKVYWDKHAADRLRARVLDAAPERAMTPQSTFLVLAPDRSPAGSDGAAGAAGRDERDAGHGRPGQRAGPVRRASTGCTSRACRARRRRRWATSRRLRRRAAPSRRLPRLPRRLRRRPADSCSPNSPTRAGAGLRAHLRALRGLRSPNADLAGLDARASTAAAANYVNWVGRTRAQIREESALRAALLAALPATRARWRRRDAARGSARALPRFVDDERQRRPADLTPPAPTPLGWRLRQLRRPDRRAAGAAAARAAHPGRRLPFSAIVLRARETTRPRDRAAPRRRTTSLRSPTLEDHDVTNPFTAFGDLKPGGFRRWTAAFFLWLLDYVGAPHLRPRLPDPGADHPFRPLGILRRPPAAVLRQQLRRQPRKLHGRLHQQGRLGPEPGLQQRRRLSRAPAG